MKHLKSLIFPTLLRALLTQRRGGAYSQETARAADLAECLRCWLLEFGTTKSLAYLVQHLAMVNVLAGAGVNGHYDGGRDDVVDVTQELHTAMT